MPVLPRYFYLLITTAGLIVLAFACKTVMREDRERKMVQRTAITALVLLVIELALLVVVWIVSELIS
jgi:hypothetical protein